MPRHCYYFMIVTVIVTIINVATPVVRFIIVSILFVIASMQDIYLYIPETNHVSRVYTGYFRGNLAYIRRTLLRFSYIDMTENPYIRS